MNIRFATDDEITRWDELIVNNPDGGNFLQSKEMADLKATTGWKPRYIIADSLAIIVLERSVLGLGKLWYVSKGPGVTSLEQLEVLLPELKAFAAKQAVFLMKIEPEIRKTEMVLSVGQRLGLIKTRNIQPNASTIFLDISGSLDDIMAGLNQKGRHAIRRAERDGAVIQAVPASDENCRQMFELYKITAEGQWAVRPYGYYKNFWQSFEREAAGKLFFAYANGQLVAAAYALVIGTKSVYKDGASLRERPVYGVSHLLQWRIIEWAKTKGATMHDFCGSPPSDQINNPDHPYYGFGRFKTSFSKEVVDFIGTYDAPIRPLHYKIWTVIGERLTLRLHARKDRGSYY
jgi:lipid II:glycine glycyltransferase (peptidoglycan interpeptide bridge formation enzyme)